MFFIFMIHKKKILIWHQSFWISSLIMFFIKLLCTTGTSGFFQICWQFACFRFGDFANIRAHQDWGFSKLYTVCANFIVLKKEFFTVKFIIDCNK